MCKRMEGGRFHRLRYFRRRRQGSRRGNGWVIISPFGSWSRRGRRTKVLSSFASFVSFVCQSRKLGAGARFDQPEILILDHGLGLRFHVVRNGCEIRPKMRYIPVEVILFRDGPVAGRSGPTRRIGPGTLCDSRRQSH